MGTKMTKLNELKVLMADALDPFSRVAAIMEPLNLPDEKPLRDCAPGVWPTLGDCRNARTALAILPALIAAVEALKELCDAEWMVYDWGGDRSKVIEQAGAALAPFGENDDPQINQ